MSWIYALFWRTFSRPRNGVGEQKMTIMRYGKARNKPPDLGDFSSHGCLQRVSVSVLKNWTTFYRWPPTANMCFGHQVVTKLHWTKHYELDLPFCVSPLTNQFKVHCIFAFILGVGKYKKRILPPNPVYKMLSYPRLPRLSSFLCNGNVNKKWADAKKNSAYLDKWVI